MNNNIDIEFIDFIDLINTTLSNEFIEKWRHRFSEKFLKHFQIKILNSLSKRKVLKIDTLYNYLTKKCKYSNEQVDNFFEAVDISIYSPLIQGTKKTTR
jgi:hypothetical protein|tara:strand:+ start:400 stop:696 length:297 start_codon:yes stop_codon:yes gene_type:complete